MIKIFFSTFLVVFLAEIGDKTQLATMLLASQSPSKISVFLGSSVALVCSSLLGVLLGSILNKYVPENLLQISSAIAFIIIGILLLLNKV
jgi:putative Ca2+/H+ antiporter (TMEM165/GDT1 family)